ncbi:hypothetical protein [Pedobacter sp. JY14-1]|uniref:hypothetical protein n=1 Tax=Pedobacter sp. JY14-1 TaxID=3034151 RepID=UPI0023E0EE4C|nr:hypothetical protein [Pedobacter sp. JY14-1]
MKRVIFHTFLMLLLVGWGCKKDKLPKDAFQKPSKVYDISVDGGINTFSTQQFIRLTKPALYPGTQPLPITGAQVVVNDSRSDIIFHEVTSGVYRADNHNAPNYNRAYRLTVKYDGKTYTAIDTLRQVVNIVDDFIPLSISSVTDSMVRGTIPKHTFGYLNPGKWYIAYRGINRWDPSAFNQNNYYSYTHRLGSPNSLYPLNNLKRNFSIRKDDLVFIYKMSVSERYANYLYSVFMETDWSGLLSGVPVNVEGNISGNAQGYFSVTDIDFRVYPAREL